MAGDGFPHLNPSPDGRGALRMACFFAALRVAFFAALRGAALRETAFFATLRTAFFAVFFALVTAFFALATSLSPPFAAALRPAPLAERGGFLLGGGAGGGEATSSPWRSRLPTAFFALAMSALAVFFAYARPSSPWRRLLDAAGDGARRVQRPFQPLCPRRWKWSRSPLLSPRLATARPHQAPCPSVGTTLVDVPSHRDLATTRCYTRARPKETPLRHRSADRSNLP